MRPYVLVNVAMSADGKISTRERRQVRISGPGDRERVDALKAGSDGVMVGIGTVLADDPSLTVKSPELRKERRSRGLDEHPVRIVVDSRARTPPGAEILHRGRGRRILAVSRSADPDRIRGLSTLAEVVTAGEEQVDLDRLMTLLYERGIRRLMVEGGGTLIGALFSQGLVDEFQVFVGNLVIGGDGAPTPAEGAGFVAEREFVQLQLVEANTLDDGVLLRWRVKKE